MALTKDSTRAERAPDPASEVLDLCAARSIAADVEIIPVRKMTEAFERLLVSDGTYRFVIDMTPLG